MRGLRRNTRTPARYAGRTGISILGWTRQISSVAPVLCCVARGCVAAGLFRNSRAVQRTDRREGSADL